MISYMIIDDEPLAHKLIEGYCDKLPHMVLRKNCYDAMEAIGFLTQNHIDLIFLDINMPKLNGFDFLRTLPKHPKVIVTTAYEEYALEGYELQVSDYLLKPFGFERFVKAVNRTFNIPAPDIKQRVTEQPSKKLLFIKGDKKYHQINLDEVLCIEAYGNYTRFHLNNKTLLAHMTISSLEEDLLNKGFLRVHKSYLISISRVETIEGNRITIKDHQIPIGQTYKRNVLALLKK